MHWCSIEYGMNISLSSAASVDSLTATSSKLITLGEHQYSSCSPPDLCDWLPDAVHSTLEV